MTRGINVKQHSQCTFPTKGPSILHADMLVVWTILLCDVNAPNWTERNWTGQDLNLLQKHDGIHTFQFSLVLVSVIWCEHGFIVHYFAPGRDAKYCDDYIYLSVCLSVWLSSGRTYQLFCICRSWPWLGLSLLALWYVTYSGFVDDVTFSCNGPMACRVYCKVRK